MKTISAIIFFLVLAVIAFAEDHSFQVNDKWTGNPVIYQKLVKTLDKELAQSKDPGGLCQAYKEMAEKNRNDAKAQFQWAYVARKAALASYPFDSGKLTGTREALDGAPSPHVYEYTRLRFLLGTEMFVASDFQQLKPVGKRLLQHDPLDEDVKYQFMYILTCSPNLKDHQDDLAMAQDLVSKSPTDKEAHGRLGDAYFSLWLALKQRVYADKAINEYKAYLRFAPLNDPYRDNNEKLISAMEKYK